MTTALGADEQRIRYLLDVRGVAFTPQPTPALETAMPEPITPTRVIPATELPPRPPQAGEVPPWRLPPPASPPPVPPPPPVAPQPPLVVHHRHVHEIVIAPSEPEQQPSRLELAWNAIRHIGRPWQLLTGLLLAFLPILPHSYSIVVTWAYCVQQTRADHGQGWGYALGVGALVLAVLLLRARGTVPRITLLAITVVGVFSAMSLYDPITWITGVHR